LSKVHRKGNFKRGKTLERCRAKEKRERKKDPISLKDCSGKGKIKGAKRDKDKTFTRPTLGKTMKKERTRRHSETTSLVTHEPAATP